jgi:hypothetical protein
MSFELWALSDELSVVSFNAITSNLKEKQAILRTSVRLEILELGSNWVCFAKMALLFFMSSGCRVLGE